MSKSATKSKKSASKKSGKPRPHGIKVVNGDDEILDAPAAAPAETTTEAPAEGSEGGAFDTAADYVAAEYPVESLVLNELRTPSEEAVAEMAKSIQRVGLQNAIVIDAEGKVISGNTRLLAFRKLGRKTIPARFAVDAKGNPITAADAAATVAGLAENLARTAMTPVELGRVVLDAIKRGVAGSEKELAGKIGVSTSYLSKAVQVANKAAGPVADSIASGELSLDAGVAIVSRCGDHDSQRVALETIRDAVKGKGKSGKITVEDVDDSVPRKSKEEKTGRARSGRPVEKAPLSADATDAEKTGISAMLRKTSDGGMMIVLTVEITADVKSFARYDLEAAVQKAAAKLDASKVRTALEEAKGRLGL